MSANQFPFKQYGKEESSVYVNSVCTNGRRIVRIMDGDEVVIEFDLTGWNEERAHAFEEFCRKEHSRRIEEGDYK